MSLPPAIAPAACTVLVVDDDHSLRESLGNLLRSAGYRVGAFANAAQLLAEPLPCEPSCLLLDVHLPGSSGFDVQAHLAGQGTELPVIFMTGRGDIPMTVRAMKAGAVDFLSKPFPEQDLLAAVDAALAADHERRQVREGEAELQDRYGQLTVRERQVMQRAVSGLMNKQIAAELGLSEITVKIHRARAMKKMAARTFAELVVMAQAIPSQSE